MAPMTYLFLVCSLIFAVSGADENCSLTEELIKLGKDAFKMFFPDQPFLTCLLDGPCDPEKFKFPEAKACKAAVRDGPLLKDLNITASDRFLENFLYSGGVDAEEICLNLRTEGDKLLAMIKKNQDEGAGSLISKLCLKDPTSCQNMEQIPKEVEDFILKNVGAPFRDLIKIVKNIAKSKSVPFATAMGQVIESFFGGGQLGKNVSKCVNEIITIATKTGKSLLG
ncbi:uncharacterized protein LOC110856634 [Folsomia candida]|uniref:uncharacterized protein LOC110856634 n=1 Tax=Folsomia candida TaxID=158441 RepID=UPI001604C12A|nr:uncharacterized protein LOC110856634 [Folsomia candida]